MPAYLVSYDLSNDKYYNDLKLAIEEYNSLNILKSVYIMITKDDIKTIKIKLTSFIPQKDKDQLKLAIIKISRYSNNFEELSLDENDIIWLNNNLFLKEMLKNITKN